MRHCGRDQTPLQVADGWTAFRRCAAAVLGRSWPLAHVATLACAGLQTVRAAGFPGDGWPFFYFDGSADGGVEVVGSLFAGIAAGARVLYTPPGQEGQARAPAGVMPYPKGGGRRRAGRVTPQRGKRCLTRR